LEKNKRAVAEPMRKKNVNVKDLVGDEIPEKSTATERNGDLSLAAQTLDTAKTVGNRSSGRPPL